MDPHGSTPGERHVSADADRSAPTVPRAHRQTDPSQQTDQTRRAGLIFGTVVVLLIALSLIRVGDDPVIVATDAAPIERTADTADSSTPPVAAPAPATDAAAPVITTSTESETPESDVASKTPKTTPTSASPATSAPSAGEANVKSADALDDPTLAATPVTSPRQSTPATSTASTTASTSAPTQSSEPAAQSSTTVANRVPGDSTGPIAPPPDPYAAEEQILLGGISIPKLGLEAPLLEGVRLTTLDLGPGHWPGSAMPGEVGNVVVAAHRTTHGGPFRNIDQLVEGDVVEFDTGSGVIEYTVTGTQIVEPTDVWIVDPTDTPTATLFACHPAGSTTYRFVVNLELS